MGKIGIFDSGFGGLTVFREVVIRLPQYDYIYLGDNARAPYGSKSQELIYEYTKQAIDYLFAHDCELIILACNTASAEALRKIQQDYLPQKYSDKKVLGVIIPTAEQLVQDGKSKKVGIIATEGTVNSGIYVSELIKLNPSIKTFQNSAPLLVPLIESGEVMGLDLAEHLKGYLAPLLAEGIDTLILGCTHYAIIECEVRRLIGPNIKIYNQSTIVATKLADYLSRHSEITSKLEKGGSQTILSTDSAEHFREFSGLILGHDVKVVQVDLGNLNLPEHLI